MEKYDYIVITKKECMVGQHTQETPSEPHFDADKLNSLLTQYGEDGFRVITKLYNSPDSWVLILSRPKIPSRRTR